MISHFEGHSNPGNNAHCHPFFSLYPRSIGRTLTPAGPGGRMDWHCRQCQFDINHDPDRIAVDKIGV